MKPPWEKIALDTDPAGARFRVRWGWSAYADFSDLDAATEMIAGMIDDPPAWADDPNMIWPPQIADLGADGIYYPV